MWPARKYAKRIPSGALLFLTASLLAAANCSCRTAAQPAQNMPERVVLLPKSAGIPELDGKGGDDFWKKAPLLDRFMCTDGERPQARTTARAARTDRDLYILVECEEPFMNKIKVKHTERDGAVYQDDSVELFLAPTGDPAVYYHIVVNAHGAVYDARIKDKSWNIDLTAAVWRGEKQWSLEMRIPFSGLKSSPVENPFWKINVCRGRCAEDKHSSWAGLYDSFHQPALFGGLAFLPEIGEAIPAMMEKSRQDNRKAVAGWKKTMEQIQADINAKNMDQTSLKIVQQQLRKEADELSGLVNNADKAAGDISAVEKKEIIARLKGLTNSLAALKASARFLQDGNAYLPFVVAPISDLPILPDESINLCAVGEISTEIKITATPGEFQPASFVVRALSDIAGLKPIASKLENAGKIIPSENIDVKLVKCWYQAGTAWRQIHQNPDKRVLVPELLLNDDSLVKVDREQEKNFLKLSFPGREKYVWISNPGEKESGEIEGDYELGHYKLLLPEKFPVRDSPRLRPVDAAKNSNQQFWVTVKTPEDAAPGTYTGKIDLVSSAGNIGSFSLELKVLPFKLIPPYYVSSVYYRAQLSQKYPRGTVSSEYKSGAQLAAELKNMAEHGVLNPTCYQPLADKALFEQYLAARTKAGMDSADFYWCYGLDITSDGSPEGILKLKERVADALKALKGYGLNDVYFYGKDEANGEALTVQRRDWQAIHEAGGKVLVAGGLRENFEKMGDIQDLLICAFQPSAEEAAKWHSVGHKIWCYANPQAGVENPAVYRRNYGILLWQNDYDGACTYAYHTSFGNTWNDFDGKYREHNFTYPTVDGVIDTLAWEGYREGVDDVRYLTTLLNEIKIAKNKPGRSGAAATAEKYLEELKQTDVMEIDLDAMRLKLAEHIMKLRI